MKVAVSVLGRFHAYDLACQLQKRDALAQLLTTYPRYEVVKYHIDKQRISSFLLLEVVRRLWAKSLKRLWNAQYFIYSTYDRYAARNLRPGADLFVGWSGSSLRTLRKAKSLGMVAVIERGSSHMVYQQKILCEEYGRWGKCFKETHAKVIEQEVAEYREADYIAIPSTFARRSFVNEGVPEEKLITVPYGCDLSSFHPVPKEDEKFRVMYCGGLTLQKGVHYLLQAFSELRLPGAELWLVGGIGEEIKPFLARYQTPGIVVHGHKAQAALAWYYSQANVFCLASIQEGMAMVLLQAMACGLPVICTTNTGGEDVVREGKEGFLVPIRDVEALKDRIRWCSEHRAECRAMGEAARQRVGSGFSWEDYGDRVTAAYRAIIGKRDKGCQQLFPLGKTGPM